MAGDEFSCHVSYIVNVALKYSAIFRLTNVQMPSFFSEHPVQYSTDLTEPAGLFQYDAAT